MGTESQQGSRFLSLLNTDPEQASKEYIVLRRKLLFFFQHQCLRDPEDCADETIARVIQRLQAGDTTLTTEISNYVYGIARNVARERRKMRIHQELDATPEMNPVDPEPTQDILHARLLCDQIKSQLSPDEFKLLREYEFGDRTGLAGALGLTSGALRVRILRLRQKIREWAMKERQ